MNQAKAVIAQALIVGFSLFAMLALKGCAGRAEFGDASAPELPSLLGRWRIDAAASADYARQSPRWSEEDGLNARRFLDMMAESYFIVIGPESIILEARGSRAEIPVTRVEAGGGRHVYRGVFSGMEVDFALTLNEAGNLNLQSSLSDDFDYILWERAD